MVISLLSIRKIVYIVSKEKRGEHRIKVMMSVPFC